MIRAFTEITFFSFPDYTLHTFEIGFQFPGFPQTLSMRTSPTPSLVNPSVHKRSPRQLSTASL